MRTTKQWLIKDGKVPDDVIEHVKNRKGNYLLIFKKHDETRSERQNRYYWAYLSIIEDETGNDSMDMHEFFKRTLLPPRFITVFNKEIKIPASTTKLDKLEFSDYIKKIEVETGVIAPDPDLIYLIEK